MNATARRVIVVAGMIAGDPHQGGATWAVLQYVLGLRKLGHEVYLVEPVDAAKRRPIGTSLEASENASYFRDVVQRFQIGDGAALLERGGRETVGLSYAVLADAAARADLLINISGMLTDPVLRDAIPTRVYLDLDPAFNQLWHEVEGVDAGFDGHTHFVTIGQAIGSASCAVPTCGRNWIRTPQPIVLEEWPAAEHGGNDAFTTIANWRAYGSITHDGVFYGQKAHSLREFMTLPAKTSERFALALAIDPGERGDLATLAANRWELLDPVRVAGTPDRYRAFIQSSKAEFGIAKRGYAAARCGWFSDRSICYLASGRPVVALDTGFTEYIPSGAGLLAFATEDEAAEAVDAVAGDYRKHAVAARAIAEEFFDSRKVLPALLSHLG